MITLPVDCCGAMHVSVIRTEDWVLQEAFVLTSYDAFGP